MKFVVFEIINKCSFIPNCTKTIMWLLINNILKKYEIAYHNYAEAKRASSAKIIYLNLYIRSKQPRTIKTVIHNDILTSIRRKKSSKSGQTVQGIVQSVSESLSMEWCRRLRGLTMLVFNFGVQSLEQSVELDQLVILISLAIPLSKHHFFQTDNQKAVHLQWDRVCSSKRTPFSR